MKRMQFEVWLKQPLVISEQAASAGAHQSLDHVPGANFLGVAAGRLYEQLSPAQAFTVFHSGQVRFGDALPLSQGELGWPVPLAWHVFKGEQAVSMGRFNPTSVFYLTPEIVKQNPGRQPEQLRGGYVTASGRKLQPRREQTLKTAIDPETGAAQDSQLFGYQAIAAGQTLRFELQADDEVDDSLWQQLQQALTGTARLGRSRSAQFGRVHIQPLAKPAQPPQPQNSGRELILWLTSDLLLLEHGQPCLQPRPELLGLPADSCWRWDKSFVRSRRYSRYNGYRRHYDAERQVISRGSVLSFELPEPASDELLSRLTAGIGRQRAEGLGQVLVNPVLLRGPDERPQFVAASQPTAEADKAVATRPETRLARLVARRADQIRSGEQIARQVQEIFAGLCDQIRRIRAYHALPEGQLLEAAPGRSQWGVLRALANQYRNDPQTLRWMLFDEHDGALRDRTQAGNKLDPSSGGAANGWQLRAGPTAEDRLGHWLTQRLQSMADADLPAVVGQLAGRGMSDAWEQVRLGQNIRSSAQGEPA